MAEVAVAVSRRKVLDFLVALLYSAELWTIPGVLAGWIAGVFGVHIYAAIGIAVYVFFFHNRVPGDSEGIHFGSWAISSFGILEGAVIGGMTYGVGRLFG